jgi:hypothetical protein
MTDIGLAIARIREHGKANAYRICTLEVEGTSVPADEVALIALYLTLAPDWGLDMVEPVGGVH